MSIAGLLGILIAFAACAISLLCLGAAHIQKRRADKAPAESAEAARARSSSDALAFGGRLAAVAAACALTFCCALLVWCFFSGDVTLDYVVRNRSDASGELAWLFQLAGLWAGRAGSLLFWAWLIAVFGAIVVFATRKDVRPLDNGALAIMQLVLVAFVGVLLFSPDNMPFALLDQSYFDENGQLKAQASVLGMNTLLEHWAMAIHPPTLFIGYAGLTVPFAYAIAALVVDDDSDAWVRASTPYLMFSWLLLGIGIGLGAVWAYVVLGWGGYWGWDPVENASLLPWLVGVALIHSFTVYRQRGAFKRWSVMCACITFSFVVLGTFITRSGIVQSVHAFEGDPVSLVLFAVLIVASLAAGAIGLIVRRKSFGVPVAAKPLTKPEEGACEAEGPAAGPDAGSKDADAESLASRDTAYYVNNLIMVVFAALLAYMTVSSALPPFMPFGGQALSAGTYNAIARPLGVIYCALIAVCPLLGWKRTQGKAFWRRARIPGALAAVAFAVLMVYFCTYLLPSYDAILDSGTGAAEGLLEQGAPAYYNAIAVVGFLVASLLFFNSMLMLVRAIRAGGALRTRLSRIGGAISHAAMGVILVGLIGSSMYVTETSQYLRYDADTGSAESLRVQDFELVYTGEDVFESDNGDDVDYVVSFDVYKGGQYVGSVSPAVQMVKSTQQQKLEASVIGFPLEDLFVVYRGMSADGEYSMDVRVNPLISFVWAGFALLMLGSLLALFAKRPRRAEPSAEHA